MFDRLIAMFALIILSPVMLVSAIGVKITSPGPIFYRAKRMGKDGKIYEMYKFRTMHIGADKLGAITAEKDKRVFPLGDILRKAKIDELPQLLNIIKGDMAIVGPRPEDPQIVQKYYTKEQWQTLNCMPGLASPGSIFNYTHGSKYLIGKNVENAYVERLMPLKLKMDLYYIKNRTVKYDIEVMIRTLYVVVAQAFGKKEFSLPKEYYAVKKKNNKKAENCYDSAKFK